MPELGEPVDWTPPPVPPRAPLDGPRVRIEPLDPRHAAALHAAYAPAPDLWDYSPIGPFDAAGFAAWVADASAKPDPMFFAFLTPDGQPVGHGSYLRINPAAGSIEVGWLVFGPRMQRTALATEAMHLMMAQAFALGYRRYEWKCNALNAASRRAAERLGFTYEGTHRQALVAKGRNRDTAWFSVLDREWPAVRTAHLAWLDPANFDARGRQRRPLRIERAAA